LFRLSEISGITPTVVLTSVQLRSDKVDQACQVVETKLADSSLKISFLNCLQDLGYTETEAKTVVTPTHGNFDYPIPTPTPTPDRLRPSAVLVT